MELGQTRLGRRRRGTLGWSSHITLPVPTPVRSSETILATLNALMVECTESRAEADLPTDAVADGSDSNAQTEQRPSLLILVVANSCIWVSKSRKVTGKSLILILRA